MRSFATDTAEGAVKPSRKQVLGDRFLLGEELGRGAYGTVFKGIDTTSGDTVAIKQISLAGISQDNLQGVMGEIELLKTLNHKNIVKYVGSFKSRSHLYIILEYMENGALSAMIKPNRCGIFPETLVAVFIAQVLQGLQYLHDQGVVHRDIKGANILMTTKEGLIKLADFGVAAKLGELEDRRDDLQQHVVGTPYWMAPEVIEMTQVTPASDIWSVGCLIVELRTGSPPYYDLQPMSALFRIVQDEQPPLPDDLTPMLADFLRQCFQKDPRRRPTAAQLLQHPWIQQNRRTLRSSWRRAGAAGSLQGSKGNRPAQDHESLTSVISRMMESEESEEAAARRLQEAALAAPSTSASVVSAGPGTTHPPLPLPLPPPPDSSLVAVNAATAAPTPSVAGMPMAAVGQGGGGAPPGLARLVSPSPLRDGALAVPLTSQPDSSAAANSGSAEGLSSAAARLQGALGPGTAPGLTAPLTAPHPPSAQVPPGAAGNGAVPGAARLWPTPGPMQAPQQPAQHASPVQYPDAQQQQQQHVSQASASPSGLTQPGQAAPLGPGRGPGPPAAGPITHLVSMLGGAPCQVGGNLGPWLEDADRTTAPSGQLPLAAGQQQPAATSLSFAAAAAAPGAAASGPELQDSADLLGLVDSGSMLELQRQVKALVRALRPSPSAPKACRELAALIARSPGAKQLMLTETGALLLLELLDPDRLGRDTVFSEALRNQFADGALELLMALTKDDVLTLETVCLLGIGPAAARYALPPYPPSLRMRAACFLATLIEASHSTLTHFVACQGLKQLVAMVADTPLAPGQVLPANCPEGPGLVLTQIAIRCIFLFLDRYSILPHNYLCRLLAQNGLVPRLFTVLKQTSSQLTKRTTNLAGAFSNGSSSQSGTAKATAALHPPDPHALQAAYQTSKATAGPALPFILGPLVPRLSGLAAQQQQPGEAALTPRPLSTEELMALQEGVVSLLLLLSNADSLVKAALCTRDNLEKHLDCLGKLQPPSLVRMVRALRWLTCEHAMLPAINEAGAIATLTPFLSRDKLLDLQQQTAMQIQQQQAITPGQQLSPLQLQAVATLPALQVQQEVLHALHNICKLNKRHLEDAATVGVIPHLVRLASDAVSALSAAARTAAASVTSHSAGPSTPAPYPQMLPASDQAGRVVSYTPYSLYYAVLTLTLALLLRACWVQVLALSVGSAAATAAAAPGDESGLLDPLCRWARLRGHVVSMLVALVSCSSSTRAKLWAASGLDVFLHLLAEQESVELGVLGALDVWLAEDHSRLEARLTQREPVAQLVALYARTVQTQDLSALPQLLATLRRMIGRSSKLAVALAVGGLVPWLLAMIEPVAPILRVKVLEIIRCLYEHYPRPKEFLLLYRIPEVLRRLLETQGRGADAVHQEAQRLLTAFQINVLF
ncbi:hypothetical protein QJQ45_029056 [Haematococcus lacustris]|nr:hypothetical protein QJQ45_029056 [Haematococcus lacustris]